MTDAVEGEWHWGDELDAVVAAPRSQHRPAPRDPRVVFDDRQP